MEYQEAIKNHINECRHRVDVIRNHMNTNRDADTDKCLENIQVLETVIFAMNELQMYKDGKLCLIPESVYSKQCTELDAYKQLGTLEEVREALEKAEKYHWHDLRKNPDDIPSGRNMCTCFAEGDFVIEDGSVAHGKYPVIIPFPFSEYEYRYNFKVVAWREIEPFEREVEE